MAINFKRIRDGINLGFLTADPSSPAKGDLYFNITSNELKFHNGTSWEVVASEDYVNAAIAGIDFSAYLKHDGSVPLTGDLDADGNTIENLPEPVNPNDAVTKEYADAILVEAKDYTDFAIGEIDFSPYLRHDGTVPISADFNANGFQIVGLAEPTAPQEAATKNYVDTTFIPLSQKGSNNGVATLDAGGKVPVTQLPSALLTYEGTWDAATNTPTLADGVGDVGMVYVVSVEGTQNLGSGAITFHVGDWAIYNGTIWQKSASADDVVSVNGQIGVVVLDTDDIGEGSSNLYFSDERAQDAVGGILTDTPTIMFTYNDAIPTIIAAVKDASITDAKIVAGVDAAKIADGSVSNTEFQYLNGVTSSIQNQLDTNATAISDHIADTTDAHDSSAISFAPAGPLLSTDVQAAIEEVVVYTDDHLGGFELDQSGATTNDVVTWDGIKYILAPVAGDSPLQSTLVNNQITPTDLVGALVSSATNKGFIMDYYISRIHSSSAGAQDTAFNTEATTLNRFNSAVYVSVAQPDGKTLIGGNFMDYASVSGQSFLIRLNVDGTTDTAFCLNSSPNFDNSVLTIAVQSDGKILVGGGFTDYGSWVGRGFLVRLNSDGTLDTAFTINSSDGDKFNSSVNKITIQSDGKILVCGGFTDYNSVSGVDRLIRLNSDGTLDSTFTNNSSAGSKFGGTLNDVIVQSDGKVIAGGFFFSYDGVDSRNNIVRLNSNGTTDNSFGSTVSDKFSSTILSLHAQSDGKILVGGNFNDYSGSSGRSKMVRLNSDGSVDNSFCSNAVDGKFNALINKITQTPSGLILIGGNFTNYDGTTGRNRFIVVNDDGTLNTTFTTAASDGNKFNAIVSGINYNPVTTLVMVVGSFTNYGGLTGLSRAVALSTTNSSFDVQATGSINGIYKPTTLTWNLGAETFAGDITGVEFSITSSGQIQYTTTDASGSQIESFVRFLINKI